MELATKYEASICRSRPSSPPQGQLALGQLPAAPAVPSLPPLHPIFHFKPKHIRHPVGPSFQQPLGQMAQWSTVRVFNGYSPLPVRIGNGAAKSRKGVAVQHLVAGLPIWYMGTLQSTEEFKNGIRTDYHWYHLDERLLLFFLHLFFRVVWKREAEVVRLNWVVVIFLVTFLYSIRGRS